MNLLREFKERVSDLEGPQDCKDHGESSSGGRGRNRYGARISPQELPGGLSHLENHQQKQLSKIIFQSFPSLFQERPGRTEILTDNIILEVT